MSQDSGLGRQIENYSPYQVQQGINRALRRHFNLMAGADQELSHIVSHSNRNFATINHTPTRTINEDDDPSKYVRPSDSLTVYYKKPGAKIILAQ